MKRKEEKSLMERFEELCRSLEEAKGLSLNPDEINDAAAKMWMMHHGISTQPTEEDMQLFWEQLAGEMGSFIGNPPSKVAVLVDAQETVLREIIRRKLWH